jgi:hypothetical protein
VTCIAIWRSSAAAITHAPTVPIAGAVDHVNGRVARAEPVFSDEGSGTTIRRIG